MTTAAANKIKAKRARRPVYGTIERVAVLETGEERLAILATHPIDRRLMKERGYHQGDEVRLEIKKPRNAKFHRLAHAVGNLLVENVEEFRHLSGHDALKKVQTKAGACCELQMIDMGTIKFGDISVPVGEVPVCVPRSLAFDEMDADEFEQFFTALCDFIDENFASVMTDEVRAEYLLMTGDQRRAV